MNAEDMERLKRHFSVVAEGLRHDLQQVAEGHQVILTEVQQFREDVKEEFKEVRALLKFFLQNWIIESNRLKRMWVFSRQDLIASKLDKDSLS